MNDGPNRASPSPNTADSATSSQTLIVPAIASTAIAATATARSRSARIISGRRPIRSDSAPLNGSTITVGSVHATPTTARANGEFEMSYACHAIATR